MSDGRIWIHNLTLLSCARVIACIITKPGRDIELVAFDASKRSKRLLSLCTVIFSSLGWSIDIRTTDYSMANLESECENISLFQVRYYSDRELCRISDDATNHLFDSIPDWETQQAELHNSWRFKHYISRSLAEGSQDLFHRLGVSAHEAAYRNREETVFVAPRGPLDDFVHDSIHFDGQLQIVRYPSGRGILDAYNKGKQFFSFVWTNARTHLTRNTGEEENLDEFDNSRDQSHDTEARIGVSYVRGVENKSRSDLDWWDEKYIDSEQILLYINRPQFTPLSTEVRSTLEELGIEWVDRTSWQPQPSLGFLTTILRACLSAIRTAGQAVYSSSFLLGFRGALLQLKFDATVERWRTFLEEHNIKVHTHVAGNARALPLAVAAETGGALDICYQYSSTHFASPLSGKVVSHNAYFTNGDLYAEQMENQGRTCDTVLVSGDTQSTITDNMKERARHRRRKLEESGCEWIMTVYDSSFGEDFHFTEETMSEFYRTVLGWALEDKTIGVVIKPKDSDELAALDAVEDTIATLKERGQCVVLDSSVLSIEAALSADLAVGMGLNSAVHEAVQAGTPGVNLDTVGMSSAMPFYDEALGQFVFTDPDRLRTAIRDTRNGETTNLGEYGEWLDKFDPFQDGKAAARISQYLDDVLTAFDNGAEPREAMKQANKQYRATVGEDYVQTFPDGRN